MEPQICLEGCEAATTINHLKNNHFLLPKRWTESNKNKQVLQTKGVIYFFVNLEYDHIKADMLSEDWNVKWSTVGMSHGRCVCVCVCNSSALAWDRCASWDRTIPVIAQPAFY